MKTNITALLISIAFATQAQIGPVEQFFYQSLWQDLPAYDSVTTWYNSKTSADLATVMTIEMGTDGKQDSMIYRDMYSNEDIVLYSAKRVSNMNVIVSYDNNSGTAVPVERFTLLYNSSNQLKQIFVATYNGNFFEESALYDIAYNADGTVDSVALNMHADMLGYIPLAEYEYSYSGGRLQEVTLRYFNGGKTQKNVFYYNNSGQVERMDLYENFFGTGLILNRSYLPYYQGGDVHYIEEYIHYSSIDVVLDQVYQFDLRNGNGGSVGIIEKEGIQVKVYPNPAHDFINIKGNNLLSYRLYDRNGLGIQKGKINGPVDLRKLPDGVYILQVFNSNGKSVSVKFIKK